MSKGRQFIEKLHKVFAQREVMGCLEISEQKNFQICEDDQIRRICIVDVDQSKSGFHIYNPREKMIYVFATDNCFFHSQDGKRCDCIVFDDACLCFVELKLEVGTHRQATEKAKDAREQLGTTITFFKNAFNNAFMEFKLEAYLVMRDNVRPAQSAQRIEVFVNFLKTYGVPLKELSDKEYKEF